MHHLLERQLKKLFHGTAPSSPEMDAFLKVVHDTYESHDEDRALLERSFDISSKEFDALHAKVLLLVAQLQAEKEGIEQKVILRTQELKQKVEELHQSNVLLVKQEAELTRANNRLLELDKVKSEFISVAAHQLRTPLSAIKWVFSLLMEEHMGKMNSAQRDLLLKGYQSNERMINLVNKMLVVTRVDSGKMAYDVAPVHIEQLIDMVLSDFTGYVEIHRITLVFHRPEPPLPLVSVDSEKICAVIQNLVENALFYTKDRGHVTVSASGNGKVVKVSVQDTGIGIPASQQLGIFNKFFRADNAARIRTDGSGLGLFLAKSIIERHGGEIGFESAEHVGTTFYFTLPITPTNVAGAV